MSEALPETIRSFARVRLFRLRQMLLNGALHPADLSPREQDMLDLFLSGLSTTSIARQLFISLHTVRNHLKHICFKFDVSSQRALRELFACNA